MKRIRCAIYTRKSSEEGLEQAFNSLHAQREACEAYVQSQKHEGWSVITRHYDDGGFSGGTMERPALKALLADIRAGEVDVVVVYKIDRLTRSLFDFAKIVETFDAATVSFVSVTQSFNTTTSMGRLTLNVLLSFAQFEREVTGERIRDKVAASRKKGMWMGGHVPIGYRLENRRLVIDEDEARTVRTIFESYDREGTVTKVSQHLDRLQLRTRRRAIRTDGETRATGGQRFGKGHIYWVLRNPVYAGKVRHKEQVWPGEHEAIIPDGLWERVQQKLGHHAHQRPGATGGKSPSLLTGKIFDGEGQRLTPTHTVKGAKRYRYYAVADQGKSAAPGMRVPAPEIEGLVLEMLRTFLGDAPRIAEVLAGRERSPTELGQAIGRGCALAAALADPAMERRLEIARGLIAETTISPEMLRLRLDLPNLEAALGMAAAAGSTGMPETVLEKAVALKRGGKAQRLIVTSGAAQARQDETMVKAVARAHRWFGMLRSGEVELITALAGRENAPRSWISQQLPLAFLAPDIVTMILDGTQPRHLNVERLLEIASVTPDWALQRVQIQA